MSKKTNSGIGFGGDALKDERERRAGKKRAAQLETKRSAGQQTFLTQSHSKLCGISPPSESILSTIREVLLDQVPNEWSKRRKLYEAALECCRLIALHHPTALGGSDGDDAVMVALNQFAQHAELISKHDQSSNAEDKAFVTNVLQIRQEAASRALLPEMSVMDPQEHYRLTLRPLRFELVENIAGHCYAHHKQNAHMDPRKLFRELTTFKTSLPIEYGSSIFVRAMENRLDLVRACITGPEDTPYANGAFLFDIYLNEYPRKPPMVKYLMTGGGKYRFNPNLYQDGKVCLSLLGTWSGPGWISGESTLLQVLVSIQSLILVNDPYFNEPGYEALQGTPEGTVQNNLYNSKIRAYSLEVCILPFLKHPCPYPEFDEALKRHFKNKKRALQRQLYDWYRSDSTSLQSLYIKYLDIMEDEKQSKRAKVTVARLPPSKEIKTDVDGVIQLDSDQEEEEEETLSPFPWRKKRKVAINQVSQCIMLDDAAHPISLHSDNDDDAKPAAMPSAASTEVVDLT